MAAAPHYPDRDSHHAHRVVRLMAKCCAAQEIGPEGAWLVAIIAHTEDSKRYSGAVTFFNHQLMPICGFSSMGRLIRARERAVTEGWLHYRPGGKRRPACYWSLIPPHAAEIPDDLSGEPQDDSFHLQFRNRSESDGFTSKIEAQTERIRTANGSPSTLALALINTSPGSELPDEATSSKGKKPEKAKAPKAPAYTPDDYATAEAFWARILSIQPERKPPNLKTWAKEIRLARERDGRTHQQILDLLDRVQADKFWWNQVTCPDTLRAKFDDLSLRLGPKPQRATRVQYAEPLAALKGVGR